MDQEEIVKTQIIRLAAVENVLRRVILQLNTVRHRLDDIESTTGVLVTVVKRTRESIERPPPPSLSDDRDPSRALAVQPADASVLV
jgi:hypothetical protein